MSWKATQALAACRLIIVTNMALPLAACCLMLDDRDAQNKHAWRDRPCATPTQQCILESVV